VLFNTCRSAVIYFFHVPDGRWLVSKKVDVGWATAAKSMILWFMKRRWKSHMRRDIGPEVRSCGTPRCLYSAAAPIFFDLHLAHHRTRRPLVREHSREGFLTRFMRSRCCGKMETENAPKRGIDRFEWRGFIFRWLVRASCKNCIFAKLYRIFYLNFSQYWSKFSKLKITVYWFNSTPVLFRALNFRTIHSRL